MGWLMLWRHLRAAIQVHNHANDVCARSCRFKLVARGDSIDLHSIILGGLSWLPSTDLAVRFDTLCNSLCRAHTLANALFHIGRGLKLPLSLAYGTLMPVEN